MIKINPLVAENLGECEISSWMDIRHKESKTGGCHCKMCWEVQYDRAIKVLGYEIVFIVYDKVDEGRQSPIPSLC